MSRWNPCCCGTGVVILPEDMVLVRAGWYHFMVMTRDGKIQVFIGSGPRIIGSGTVFWQQGGSAKGLVGYDGTNYSGSTLYYIDETGMYPLSNKDNLDPDAWKLVDNGSHGGITTSGINVWYEGVVARDYIEGPPYYGQSYKIFDMHTLYPEACSGFGSATGASGEFVFTQGPGYYTPEFGFDNAPNPAVSIGGCPHYRIIGNVTSPTDGQQFINPSRYINFDGSGATIGRPPGCARHGALIEARGLSLVSGITSQTLYESYDPIAKPAPADHPLAIPTDLKTRLDSGERKVIDIECGAYHNIVRLDDNTIVCWGLNAYGQCNVPEVLKPNWEITNGEIISASIDFAGITTSQRLVKTENPELQIFETGTPPPPLTGSGGKVRLLTTAAAVPDGPRVWEVTGIEILKPGRGYRQEYINWKLPGNEVNASVLYGGITFSIAPITNLSNIKDTICSIHAGFNTSAVLFHGGTALCWGDPDVADEVNSWEHIRISPIKKGEFNENNCNGVNTKGYIDPEYPQFPEDKYKKGTHNANTDWFGLWRTGAPAYPHFDLGVETPKNYPYEWDFGPSETTQATELSVPYGVCDECNTYWNTWDGGEKIKDFAVAMLRTGQIVTSRKTNARGGGSAPLCRDCSYDDKYLVSDGNVGVDYIGPNMNITAPDGSGGERDCLALAAAVGLILPNNICSKTGDIKTCDEFKKWYIPSDDIQCGLNAGNNEFAEGIGCYSTNGLRETVFYDQNWAKISNFFTPGKQVRPESHPLGPVPYWNTQSIDATYGWETVVAQNGRSHTASPIWFVATGCGRSDDFEPSKCVVDLGNVACSLICPSVRQNLAAGFRRRGNVGEYGSLGMFRYPLQIANTLMCSAGTNTVNWMHYPRLLNPAAYNQGIQSGDNLKGAAIVTDNCANYHESKIGCAECDYYSNNPLLHVAEVADTSNACIYAKLSTGELNGNNPLRAFDPCSSGTPVIGQIQTFMLPTRPWGPWQLFTSSGTASPLETEMSLCSWGFPYDFCAYMKISQNPYTDGGEYSFAWDTDFGNSNGTPVWFSNYTDSPNNTSVPYQREEGGGGVVVRRAIRREGGIRPVSGAWKVAFTNPDQIGSGGGTSCYYPDECFDKDANGNIVIPPGGSPISGRCPAPPETADRTTPQEPLSYVDCSTQTEYQPCGSGILGGQIIDLPKYCWPETFESRQLCIDNTSSVCGSNGCDRGIGDRCNRWFMNNPALSYATGRMFSVFIRRCPWYRGEAGFVTDIAGGGYHSMLINTAGEFFGWGKNTQGQITSTGIPVDKIDGGENHTIIRAKTTSEVFCFGDNTYGQTDVPSVADGATAISAGVYHSMALKKNSITNLNEVICWGCVKEIRKIDAKDYILGDIVDYTLNVGAGNDPLYPGNVVLGITNSGGPVNGRRLYYDGLTASMPKSGKYDMQFRVRNLGGVTATIAIEDYEKYADFKPSRLATFQVPLTGVSLIYGITQNWITIDVKDIEFSRRGYSFVIRDITSVYGGITGWDFNWFKVLPQEPNNKGQCNVPTVGVTSPSAISAGKYHSVAIIDPGSSILPNVICWGNNDSGQCDVPSGLTGVVDIKAGNNHTVALKQNGEVVCWGALTVQGITGVSAIASGANHGLALKTDGNLITFGVDDVYGLKNIPAGLTRDPSGLTGITVTKIACGDYHNIVLRSDNVVVAWGLNDYGQISVPPEAYNTGLTGGEFIWEPHCPDSYQTGDALQNSTQLGWKRVFKGTRGTKIWTAGLIADPCPPWPIYRGITAYYPNWVPRASGENNNVAKKGVWLNGTWTPTGGTGPGSYEKYVLYDGFTLGSLASDFTLLSNMQQYATGL